MTDKTVILGLVTAAGLAGLLAGADPLKACSEASEGAGTITQRADDASQPDLSSLIADPRTLSVVRCDLDNARWGAYDTRIYVAERGADKSYILTLSKGQLSTRIVTAKPAWVVFGSGEEQRDGKVIMTSADEAFGKGVPFYVSAEFQPPDSLRVTVVSNPRRPIDRATLFTAWNTPAGGGSMKDCDRFRSAGEPQTFVVRDDGFRDTAAINVWVRQGEVNQANPFADMPHCLISNEVEVRK